uniref:Proton-coupled amino acid transporter 1 n=1 Tax=Lygus hesperus TaxID=30085 RepID=A0A146MHN7_LYGHE
MVKGEEGTKTVFIISKKQSISEKGNEGHEPTEQEKHPTTYFETLTHMVKACFGTGILAIPSAFSQAGWAVGIIGTIIVGSICTYAFHVLLNAEKTLKRKRADIKKFTYYSIAQASVEEGPKNLRWMAPHVPTICKVFFVVAQMGTCCIYVVFISKNLKEIIDYYQDPKDRIATTWYMISTIIPLVLINWVRNLKYLAPFSIVGSTATFISFGIIFYYIFQDVPGLSKVEPICDVKGFITFFSTVLFSMEAVAVVMPLKNQMQHPEQFGMPFGVLNAAMIPNLILFISLGFFGYLKYGSDIKESIPLSLPSNEITARVSRLLLILAIYISHPLQLYMAFDVVWIEYLEPRTKNYKTLVEYIVRTTLVLLTVVFAVSIPHLNLFIALIGSLCYSTLGLTFPALISISVHWYDRSGWQFFLWAIQNYVIIFIGLSGLFVGASSALRDIVHQLLL